MQRYFGVRCHDGEGDRQGQIPTVSGTIHNTIIESTLQTKVIEFFFLSKWEN